MSIVKITDRGSLDELASRIIVTLGRKVAQQDILDACVKLGVSEFDRLVSLLEDVPVLDRAKITRIKQMSKDHASIPYDTAASFPNPEDEELFGE
jgi:hypothetical protein